MLISGEIGEKQRGGTDFRKKRYREYSTGHFVSIGLETEEKSANGEEIGRLKHLLPPKDHREPLKGIKQEREE